MALVRGSAPRALRKAESRKLIQREAHNLVLDATSDGIPEVGFDYWADLRRQRRRIWGGLLRFVDALIAKGYPEKVVQIIPDLLREYVADQYRGPDGPGSTRAA